MGRHLSEPVTPENVALLDPESWPLWRKDVPVHAVRIDGPFSVVYRSDAGESVVNCDDGYLAIDARGYPYQIAVDEFNMIYRPVTA